MVRLQKLSSSGPSCASCRLQKYSFISSRFSAHRWEAVNHVLILSAELNGEYAPSSVLCFFLFFFFLNACSVQIFLKAYLIHIFSLGRTVQALGRAGSWRRTPTGCSWCSFRGQGVQPSAGCPHKATGELSWLADTARMGPHRLPLSKRKESRGGSPKNANVLWSFCPVPDGGEALSWGLVAISGVWPPKEQLYLNCGVRVSQPQL